MRVCIQKSEFAHKSASFAQAKNRSFVNSINKYFAYINKKAEDFLFDLKCFYMISKCFSAAFMAVVICSVGC